MGVLASARIPDRIEQLFRSRVGDEFVSNYKSKSRFEFLLPQSKFVSDSLALLYGCTNKFRKAMEDLRPSRMGEVFYRAGLEVYYNEYKFQIAWNKNTDLKKVNQMYVGTEKKSDGEPVNKLGAGAPLYQYAEVGWLWNKKKYHHILKKENDECIFETSIEENAGVRRSDWNPLHCNALDIANKVMNAIGGQCTYAETTIDNHLVVLGEDCTCYSKRETPDGFQHISEDYSLCAKSHFFGPTQKKVEEVISAFGSL